MEREFEKPEIDFYLVTSAGGEKYMATLGHKGGFIYYAFDSVIQGNISKIVVHQLDNIVEICGAPDVKVDAISPDNPKTVGLYFDLCSVFNDFLKKQFEEIKTTSENKDDEGPKFDL